MEFMMKVSMVVLLLAALTVVSAQNLRRSAAVTAEALVAIAAQKGTVISSSKYATDEGGPAEVDVKGLNNAICWVADLDIDCDGKETAVCNGTTDPTFWNQTAAITSTSDWETPVYLDASTIPYFVIPTPSARFDYSAFPQYPINNDLYGAVAAIIWNGKISYAVFGDLGPEAIIGEASYATAVDLGIDPDPAMGGVDAVEVTYIIFTGESGRAAPIENHAEAVRIGALRAQELIDFYNGSPIIETVKAAHVLERIGNEHLSISASGPHELRVFDAQGSQRELIRGIGEKTYDFRSVLSPGMYVVDVVAGGTTRTVKMMVSR